MDRGPLLTSAIIFYLAIGAAIFEVLEEPHWKEAKQNYYTQKVHLLKEFPCLGQEGLDKILQVSGRPCPCRRSKRARAPGALREALHGSGAPTAPAGSAGGGRAGAVRPRRGLAAGTRRSSVDTGVTHTRRLFGKPVCPERRGWG